MAVGAVVGVRHLRMNELGVVERVVVGVVRVGVVVRTLVGRLVLLSSRRGAIRLLHAVDSCTLAGVG